MTPELKARIGYVVPSVVRVPSDWDILLPPGVGMVAVTLNVKAHRQEEFQRAVEAIRDGALTLKGEGADVIVVAGTPLATLRGRGNERPFVAELERLTGLPSITALGASVLAMERLGVKKIAVLTPYRDELNQGLKRYLEDSGLAVMTLTGCGVQRPVEVDRIAPGTYTGMAKQALVEAREAEALYIDGRWPVVESIEEIEGETGKPVITSHQAVLWWALRTMRVEASRETERFGRLFRRS